MKIDNSTKIFLQVIYSINMVPRHLPKKLLCVALIGTSMLAVIYYFNGISNSTTTKLVKTQGKEPINSIMENNKEGKIQIKGKHVVSI